MDADLYSIIFDEGDSSKWRRAIVNKNVICDTMEVMQLTQLNEFVKDKEFGSNSGVEVFPEGETSLGILSEVGVETKTFPQSDGTAKERYILAVGDKKYSCGVQVMQGIKKIVSEGALKGKVIRSGLEKNDTKYVVVKEE